MMFETETFGTCLVRKLKWGGGGMSPLPPLVATPLVFLLKHKLTLLFSLGTCNFEQVFISQNFVS